MPESGLKRAVRQLIDDLSADVVEERIVHYIIREVHIGRKLAAVLQDPYVRNRLDGDKLDEVLEKAEVIEAVESEMTEAFRKHDFKFTQDPL